MLAQNFKTAAELGISERPSESQAAIALRSYLTTGKTEWPLALSSGQ